MKVSVDVLRRVYEGLKDQGDHTQVQRENIVPESHLFMVDAYDMPRWVWSQERGTFERYLKLTPRMGECVLTFAQDHIPVDYLWLCGVANNLAQRPAEYHQAMCHAQRTFCTIDLAVERSREARHSEINKAATGQGRGAVLAPWNACA